MDAVALDCAAHVALGGAAAERVMDGDNRADPLGAMAIDLIIIWGAGAAIRERDGATETAGAE